MTNRISSWYIKRIFRVSRGTGVISFDWQSLSSNWSATAAFVLPVKNARHRSNNSSFSNLIEQWVGGGEREREVYRSSDAINACSKSISDKTNFYSSITFVDNKRFLATGRLVQSIERERERKFSSKFHYPCIFIEFKRTDQSKEKQRKKERKT